MTKSDLNKILDLHQKWLNGEDAGERADLSGANLRRADLCSANLRRADLRGADLCSADLSGADLSGANLSGADLGDATLSGANLSGADLGDATLSGADLGDATLSGAKNIDTVEYNENTAFFAMQCPESGSYTAYKGEPAGTQVASDHDKNFLYVVGQTVEVPDFDTDRWKECSSGIHHFITRSEAVKHNR